MVKVAQTHVLGHRNLASNRRRELQKSYLKNHINTSQLWLKVPGPIRVRSILATVSSAMIV
jgi:hypothetical protein